MHSTGTKILLYVSASVGLSALITFKLHHNITMPLQPQTPWKLLDMGRPKRLRYIKVAYRFVLPRRSRDKV